MSTSKTVLLGAEMRELKGKYGAKRMRDSGRIPAIMYGVHEPMVLSVDEKEFGHQFRHVSENVLIDLDIKGDVHHVIIKDYSTEVLTRRITHLDFLEIEKGKMLRTHIPVMLTGSANGVKNGGVLEQPIHEIEIECLPKDIPAQIDVDISDMEIGDSFHISDLSAMEGVKIFSNAEMVICHIATARMIQTETAAEEEEVESDAEEE